MKSLSVVILIFSFHLGISQVVTLDLVYPTDEDSLTIIFDATKGTAQLAGVQQVYVHTGVITNFSMSDFDWKYQKGVWGESDSTSIEMENIGGDLHRLKIHVRNFYGVWRGEEIRSLVFVFRNDNGTLVGKNADGSDIYIPIFKEAFSAKFISPSSAQLIAELNSQINIKASATDSAVINVFHDNILVSQIYGKNLNFNLPVVQVGKHYVTLDAQRYGQADQDTFYYVVNAPAQVQDPPPGTISGINYINDTTVVFSLLAPGKQYAYFLWDENNWEIDPAYQMNRSVDGRIYWFQLNSVVPGKEYPFQYLVDGLIRIGDPYADKVLSQFEDKEILNVTYPDLIDYPEGKTVEMVSVFQTAQVPYQRQLPNFQRPWQQDLVIYECLINDFIYRHDFETMIDSLGYFEHLGINAIQLMPVMEFDGNRSWGYGTAFYFAPDKYYGPKNDLKRFIDEAHKKGIAVILDISLNHAFGQNPWVRLYYDQGKQRPASNNPWLNAEPAHPFNVGFDFNHESQYTRDFVDRVLAYWVTEFNIDGYRFDLSKGYTQNYTGDDVSAWGNYDGSRIYNLKRMADVIRNIDPDLFLILEHFANNDEEIELSNYGFMLWGVANHQYSQAAMGYLDQSDFTWNISSKDRGWIYQHLVGYMESHDEERMMYRNLQYGNSSGTYDVTELKTALQRIGLAATFLFTVPGPKMFWQFGEFGYDFSIQFNCRTCPKPIVWQYLNEPDKGKLLKIFSALIKLKTGDTAFRSSNYTIDAGGYAKRINIYDSSMDVVVLGNFNVVSQDVWPNFPYGGTWYDYFSGVSISVSDPNGSMFYEPGEYHIYTSKQLPIPDLSVPTSIKQAYQNISVRLYPNPFTDEVNINYEIPHPGSVKFNITDMLGENIYNKTLVNVSTGHHNFQWEGKDEAGNNVNSGVYFVTIDLGYNKVTRKIIFHRS